MAMYKVVVKHENGRKNWADQLVQEGLIFFKNLVPDQNFWQTKIFLIVPPTVSFHTSSRKPTNQTKANLDVRFVQAHTFPPSVNH